MENYPIVSRLYIYIYIWLVVSTPLKDISQTGLLFPIYGKINFMFQTTNEYEIHIYLPINHLSLYETLSFSIVRLPTKKTPAPNLKQFLDFRLHLSDMTGVSENNNNNSNNNNSNNLGACVFFRNWFINPYLVGG